jgi:hypothetical protein
MVRALLKPRWDVSMVMSYCFWLGTGQLVMELL